MFRSGQILEKSWNCSIFVFNYFQVSFIYKIFFLMKFKNTMRRYKIPCLMSVGYIITPESIRIQNEIYCFLHFLLQPHFSSSTLAHGTHWAPSIKYMRNCLTQMFPFRNQMVVCGWKKFQISWIIVLCPSGIPLSCISLRGLLKASRKT